MKRFVPPASYFGGPGSNLVQQLDYLLGGMVFLRFLVQIVLYCKLGHNCLIVSISVSYILYKMSNLKGY